MFRIFISLLISFFIFSSNVYAHNPRTVDEDAILVENPEVSQVFYSQLSGVPQKYSFVSDKPFSLYIGILVPDVEDIDTDYFVKVFQEETVIAELDGSTHDWKRYYEPFGGDWYLEGPEFPADYESELPVGEWVEAGEYTVEISSTDNYGKYAFVIGEEESWPVKEIWDTFITLPKVKKDFFGRPAYTAFLNLFTGFFVVGFVVVGITAFFLFKYFRRMILMKKVDIS